MSENFDFMPLGDVPKYVSMPVVMPINGESSEQKFERFARQISRCVQACSLCKAGEEFVKVDNTFYDPHVTPSLQHSRIVLLKSTPSPNDLIFGLFGEFKGLFTSVGLDFNSIYKTSVYKCSASSSCPYFELEMKALKPALIIMTDSLFGCSDKMGFDNVELFGTKIKAIWTPTTDNLKPILRLVKSSQADPLIRSRLLS